MCTANIYGMFDINIKEFQSFFLVEDKINPKGSLFYRCSNSLLFLYCTKLHHFNDQFTRVASVPPTVCNDAWRCGKFHSLKASSNRLQWTQRGKLLIQSYTSSHARTKLCLIAHFYFYYQSYPKKTPKWTILDLNQCFCGPIDLCDVKAKIYHRHTVPQAHHLLLKSSVREKSSTNPLQWL